MLQLSGNEIAVLDRNSELLGVPTRQLMENAGSALADHLLTMEGEFLMLVGPGNNGGDALVAARLLANLGRDLEIVPVAGRPRTALALDNFDRLPASVVITPFSELATALGRSEVVVDGMLGVGLSRPLAGDFAEAVELINESGLPIVAVDVPTGMGSDTCPENVVSTVTFHAPKTNMTGCGEIIVASIGIPAEAVLKVLPGDFLHYPRPDASSHKGQRGRVLVIGGGPYVGAPYLAAAAALRSGVDLVTLAWPRDGAGVVLGPDLLYHPLDGALLEPVHTAELVLLAENMQAVVIGPGMGSDPSSGEMLKELIPQLNCPVVLDADAIHDALWHVVDRGVITPHRAEFERLVGAGDDLDPLLLRTSTTQKVVLLKGPVDRICDGMQIKLNETGNPRMAVGGTGDVLAGVVGGMLALGLSPFVAARLAAHLVGSVGDRARVRDPFSFVASDLLTLIGPALADLVSLAHQQ